MSIKYVCGGECQGVSETPKNCGNEACSHHGQPLVAQDVAQDAEHAGACCSECETKLHTEELAA